MSVNLGDQSSKQTIGA